MKKKPVLVIMLILISFVLTSCANLGSSRQQVVTVNAYNPETNTVIPAECLLSNDDGIYRTKSNWSTLIGRDKDNLEVECRTADLVGKRTVDGSIAWRYVALDTLFIFPLFFDGFSAAWTEYPVEVTLPMGLKSCKVDADGDGVVDCKDKCPFTPKGVAVDSKGCPLDSDGDGVPDHLDKCPKDPNKTEPGVCGCGIPDTDSDGDSVADCKDKCPETPKGASVNVNGCWILKDVNFDTDKTDIKPGFFAELNKVAVILRKNPDMKVEVQGHTDNVFTPEHNQTLSEGRAAAIKDYLVKEGIATERMIEMGFGQTKPIATNDTAEGRAQNRRVELIPIK
jgi:outer membrane protein OmpA-like peptidoglycan-associated protein